MKKIGVILTVFLSFLMIGGYSQSSTDSTVMQYLRTVKDTPTPILKITKKRGKTLRSTNFFIELTDSLQHKDMNLKTFIFGSSASHARKYFLLQAISNGLVQNKIIDSPTLETAIISLFAYIKKWDLSDAEKSVFVREITYAYN